MSRTSFVVWVHGVSDDEYMLVRLLFSEKRFPSPYGD